MLKYRLRLTSFFCYITILSLLLAISPEIVNAQSKTVIKSILKNGEAVPEAIWNNLSITEKDAVTFYFAVEGYEESETGIIYKIFVTGNSSRPSLDSYKNNNYTLENLNSGVYLFKVQGFINGTNETNPAILRFSVKNAAAINSDETNDYNSFFNMGTMIIIFISIIVLILFIYVFRKFGKSKKANANNKTGKEPGKRKGSVETQNNSIAKRENSNEEETVEEEHFDYKYAYENLKKEYDKLRNENSFLKGQITGLNTNVKDLETANVQLAAQKDRLLESKRQLEELQAQKEELFTIVLHDIKNPASAIKGFVELLESYDLNAHEQQEIMHGLADTSSKIIELAQQMSVVLARQTPEPVYNPEKASVKGITDAVCKRNFAYAKKKGINIINNTSPNTPETMIDINKIEEVIDNLINNSIKYSPAGTIIYVRSFFNGSKITIEVEDNGVGLSEDDVKKAFQKGVLLSTKPTGDETRSGLGLWISKKIIEEHGGNIWIKSKQGIGTKVSFDLPIKKV